jgi:putative protease
MVTRAYRKAIDAYFADPENYDPKPYLREIMTTSNRTFSSAFVGGHAPDSTDLQNLELAGAVQYYDFVASVQVYDSERKIAIIEGRNRINLGDTVEFVTKDDVIIKVIDKITNIDGEEVTKVDPNKLYHIELDQPVDSYTMVRKRNVKISEDEMENIINDQYISLGQGQAKVVKV